jgi:hypothetical protein
MPQLTEKLIRATAVIIVAMGLCPFVHVAPKYKVLHRFTGTDD